MITNHLETSQGVAIHSVHTTIVVTTVRFLFKFKCQVLVSSVDRLVVTIHGLTGTRDLIFALVAGVTDTWCTGLLCLQLIDILAIATIPWLPWND